MLAKTTSPQLVQRFMMFSFILLMTWTSYSQTTVTVRYANGTYDCNTEEYCLDVEFQADEVGQEVYGMNVRFFYDDDILEFVDFGISRVDMPHLHRTLQLLRLGRLEVEPRFLTFLLEVRQNLSMEQ